MENRRNYFYTDPLALYGSYFLDGLGPNKRFQRAVEKDVYFDTDELSLALFYYLSLGNKLVYDDLFDAFSQDLSIDFVKDIYHQDIHDVTLNHNKVVCSSWAGLFAYFLNKNHIEAVVSSSGTHKYVTFKAGGYLCQADATCNLADTTNHSSMSDLTRVKLGLQPCGVSIISNDEKLGVVYQNVFESNIILDSRIFSVVKKQDYKLQFLLDELKSKTDFEVLNCPKEYQEIGKKFGFIHEMLLDSNLDVIGGMTYLNSLIRNILTPAEQARLSYDYLKEFDGHHYHYLQLINYSDSVKFHKRDYTFHPSTEGINFVYRGEGLEIYTKRKARQLQEKNDQIELQIADYLANNIEGRNKI